jgi:hypothetical protein
MLGDAPEERSVPAEEPESRICVEKEKRRGESTGMGQWCPFAVCVF